MRSEISSYHTTSVDSTHGQQHRLCLDRPLFLDQPEKPDTIVNSSRTAKQHCSPNRLGTNSVNEEAARQCHTSTWAGHAH